jgi:hypothetical protein
VSENRDLVRRPAGLKPATRICCLTGKEDWVDPGQAACTSMRHGHMDLAHVDAQVAGERMEWVRGERQVLRKGQWTAETCWIPVARFVKARTWRKTMSGDGQGQMAVMQLVP